MKVICMDLNKIEQLEGIVACIGYFDGMHLGHMRLIEETLKQAEAKSLKSACITFDPDPWCVIKQMEDIAHITSMEERIEIGRQCGLDYWIIISFTKQLASLSYQDFEKMLAQMNIKSLICGFDYSYGYKGEGNVETLKKQSYFDVVEVEEVTYEDEKISSTRIEKSIQEGDMKKTLHLLGRPYSIKGTITEGRSLGHTIGFPTANLKMKYHSILPHVGVYIGYAYVLGKHYKCMINVGHNPTFNYKEDIAVEAYLVDFEQKIYGDDMELIFIERIRDEKRFDSKEDLVEQLKRDVLKAKSL